jgi:UDP-3-O-[3-hydroxymyristoyl] glucosamine N-acyltransferase
MRWWCRILTWLTRESRTLFDPKPKASAGIHPSAVIAPDAMVDPAASIGPFVVIEAGARIAANVTLGAHCFIGARSEIGEGGWLAPRVTLYHDVRIGKRVVIQSGAVLGGEGFGFRQRKRYLAEDRPDRWRDHRRRCRDWREHRHRPWCVWPIP